MRDRGTSRSSTIRTNIRPSARGKFIWVGDEKLYIRGVTYGTFRPDASGNQSFDTPRCARDVAAWTPHSIMEAAISESASSAEAS